MQTIWAFFILRRMNYKKMLDICATYANGHDIKFNTKQTVCMTILPRNFRDLYVPSVTLGGNELKFVDSHKYLRFQLNNKSTRADDMEIHQQYRNLCCRANSMSRIFAMCSYSVKKYLHTAYCSNVLYFKRRDLSTGSSSV